MLPIRPLDDAFAVAPQLAAADIPAIATAGYRTIVNNRPDGEEHGQPSAAELSAAAAAVGLGWREIPVGAGGIGPDALDATRAAMRDGPILAFCRSGTRSCHLWALARAAAGDDPAALIGQAAAAGYDLRPLAPTLAALAGR